jgi:hypothetical protein
MEMAEGEAGMNGQESCRLEEGNEVSRKMEETEKTLIERKREAG